MPDNALPSAILCLPFVVSVMVLLLRGLGRRQNVSAWLMTGTGLLGLLLSLWLYPAIAAGGALRQVIPWAPGLGLDLVLRVDRSEEQTSELQSLMRISYAVFCLTKKTHVR